MASGPSARASSPPAMNQEVARPHWEAAARVTHAPAVVEDRGAEPRDPQERRGGDGGGTTREG